MPLPASFYRCGARRWSSGSLYIYNNASGRRCCSRVLTMVTSHMPLRFTFWWQWPFTNSASLRTRKSRLRQRHHCHRGRSVPRRCCRSRNLSTGLTLRLNHRDKPVRSRLNFSKAVAHHSAMPFNSGACMLRIRVLRPLRKLHHGNLLLRCRCCHLRLLSSFPFPCSCCLQLRHIKSVNHRESIEVEFVRFAEAEWRGYEHQSGMYRVHIFNSTKLFTARATCLVQLEYGRSRSS